MSDPLIQESEFESTPSVDQVPMGKTETMSVIDYPHLKNYLGMPSPTHQEVTDMQQIWEFLSKDAKSVGEALSNLRSIENKLAAPQVGENRLTIIKNYIKVMRNLDDLNQEAKSYQK